jgi:hypothetical protein
MAWAGLTATNVAVNDAAQAAPSRIFFFSIISPSRTSNRRG